MSPILRVQWTIADAIAPRPWLNCPRCGGPRPFASSDRIRLNANGKRLDAWLIYRCTRCQTSWNRPLFERRPVGEIDPAMLRALQGNDPGLVRRAAFDVAALRRSAGRIDACEATEIRKRLLSAGARPLAGLEIETIVPAPTAARADRLLAREFGVTRARIEALAARGRLALAPQGARMLRRPLRDGMRIRLDLSGEDACDLRAQVERWDFAPPA
jgi:hypothetical protein